MKATDRLLQRWRIAKARRYLRPGMRVLDIGCADGAMFRLVPGLEGGVGVDPDAVPDRIGSNQLVPGLFPEALPEGRRRFDAITLLAVLEHVPAEAQARLADDCFEALVPGGHLLITVPSPAVDHVLAVLRALRLIHGMSLEQHYGYDVRQTPAIFGRAGLELVKAQKFQLGLNNFFAFRRPPAAAPHAEGPG
jgi:cyclopropane fatty-acyl-phospholipid synthase-like methyltransferase